MKDENGDFRLSGILERSKDSDWPDMNDNASGCIDKSLSLALKLLRGKVQCV